MKTLIIDNYDSFTFNLFQLLGELKGNPLVRRNDELSLSEVRKINPTHIVISPGPGVPSDPKYFGVNLEVIREFKKTPILGVCLGHQGICHAFGGKVVRAPEIRHGKTSEIIHTRRGLFQKISSPLEGMRYHSLIVERKSLPCELKIIAEESVLRPSQRTTEDTKNSKIVMAVEHVSRPLFGIQFHPESVGTPAGKQILANFLAI